MNYKIPRLLISATKSNEGKTLITCALGKILSDSGYNLCCFKCGPDYIDPKIHKILINTESSNLDLFFNSFDLFKERFIRKTKKHNFALIEGAMGFYDGMGGKSVENSSYDVAQKLMCPTILVVDVRGTSISLCAAIMGFTTFEKNLIKGVILNRCSAALFSILKPIIEERCNVSALGYIPQDENLLVKNEKLGLKHDDTNNLTEKISYLAEIMKQTVNINEIISIANESETFCFDALPQKVNEKLDINVSVAKDEAFCFYYEDNIEFLKSYGCNINFFSPLYDSHIPENTDICYFGGGYIEKNAALLSQNIQMLSSIREFKKNDGSFIAEGGGFVYLNKCLIDQDGKSDQLCGIFDGECHITERLHNFGYITLYDNMNKPILKGHEFHYSDCSFEGDSFIARRQNGTNERKTMIYNQQMLCGFPQFDYISNGKFILNFLKNYKRYKNV